MLIKLRPVAGRNMSVEMGEGATVLDTLSKVCEEYGYKLAGSKLVLGGTTLDEAVGVAEALCPFADAPAKPSSPRKLSQKESARRQRLADAEGRRRSSGSRRCTRRRRSGPANRFIEKAQIFINAAVGRSLYYR
ncbi:hypothetical protein DIPPA_04841 [Diplonema papillatum]|nr:hypothetical protein DIPPA_04841 [Diplonema papillatum]